MRVKLILGYDGTNYCGWQIQPNGNSIQGAVECAIKTLTGVKVKVTGSGRTDAGVHANGQVAHFDIDGASIPAERYANALNTVLAPDIRIYHSEQVKDDFNACRTAKKKTYKYSLYLAETENPLKERYALKISPKTDVDAMEKVSKIFVGEHDFKAFKASGGSSQTTVRTVYSIEFERRDSDLSIYITGNGFLYNMVRIMVGTLLGVGEGRLTQVDLENMLNTGERKHGGKTLPAKALCLEKVEY